MTRYHECECLTEGCRCTERIACSPGMDWCDDCDEGRHAGLTPAPTETTVSYHVEDGVGRPAINVKVRAPGAAFWPSGWDEFDEVRGWDYNDIVGRASDRITSDFWQAASEIAEQRGLGSIEQQGRSGGWLVFTSGYDPQTIEDTIDPSDDPRDTAVTEWLAGYRSMVEWADTWIADAPRKVAALAQQLAMDEAGHEAGERMFAFGGRGAIWTAAEWRARKGATA